MATNDNLPRKVRLQTLAHAIAAFPPPVSESPMPDHSFKDVCAYCTRVLTSHFHVTVDHVIPRWVTRAFRDDFPPGPHNYVKACQSCNKLKGGMPLAVFIRHRYNSSERKRHEKYWAGVIHRIGSGRNRMRKTHPEYERIRDIVIRAYGEVVPELGLPREMPSEDTPPWITNAKKKPRPLWRAGAALLDEDYQIRNRI